MDIFDAFNKIPCYVYSKDVWSGGGKHGKTPMALPIKVWFTGVNIGKPSEERWINISYEQKREKLVCLSDAGYHGTVNIEVTRNDETERLPYTVKRKLDSSGDWVGAMQDMRAWLEANGYMDTTGKTIQHVHPDDEQPET